LREKYLLFAITPDDSQTYSYTNSNIQYTAMQTFEKEKQK